MENKDTPGTEIKRYDISVGSIGLEECNDGTFVLYSDYTTLQSQLSEAKEDYDTYKGLAESCIEAYKKETNVLMEERDSIKTMADKLAKFLKENKLIFWQGNKMICDEDCQCHTECNNADEKQELIDNLLSEYKGGENA